jgi:hypothetical protein
VSARRCFNGRDQTRDISAAIASRDLSRDLDHRPRSFPPESKTRSVIGCGNGLSIEETRETVVSEHKGHGYEIGTEQFLIVEDEELDTIAIESTHKARARRRSPDLRYFNQPQN